MSPKAKTALIGVGALAGAALIGYVLYRHFVKPQVEHPDINPAPPVPDTSQPQLPAGVPTGSMHVRKGAQVVAQVHEIASGKTRGDRYVPVQADNTDAYGREVITFKSPIDGYFTGRVYVKGNKRYAELIRA